MSYDLGVFQTYAKQHTLQKYYVDVVYYVTYTNRINIHKYDAQ